MKSSIERNLLKGYTPKFTTVAINENRSITPTDDNNIIPSVVSDNELMPLIKLLYAVHVQIES